MQLTIVCNFHKYRSKGTYVIAKKIYNNKIIKQHTQKEKNKKAKTETKHKNALCL